MLKECQGNAESSAKSRVKGSANGSDSLPPTVVTKTESELISITTFS